MLAQFLLSDVGRTTNYDLKELISVRNNLKVIRSFIIRHTEKNCDIVWMIDIQRLKRVSHWLKRVIDPLKHSRKCSVASRTT